MQWTTLAIAASALLLLVLERIPAIRRVRMRVLRPHFAADLVLLFVGFVAGGRLALDWVGWASDALGALGAPRLSAAGAPLWATTALAVVLLDLGNYVCHATLHRFDALWELHKVHHSSRRLDWLATFRSHPLEQVVRRLLAPAMLIVAGVPLDAIAVAAAIVTSWAMVNHSNARVNLAFLEPVFITPRLHHLHHAPETSDRNFGTVFSFWDRLLGRLVHQRVEPEIALGVPGETTTYPEGLGAQMLEPMRRIASRLRARRSARSTGVA